MNLDSDALRANLLETAVGEVIIDPSFEVLREVVKDYKGINNSLDHLLYELSHPFRNWKLILPELRVFVLKNVVHYQGHPKGPVALNRFAGIFFSALEEGKKNDELVSLAMESLLAFLDKVAGQLTTKTLPLYGEALNSCFIRLHDLDDRTLMFMVQGHHPVKRIADRLMGLAAPSFDFDPLSRLMMRLLTLNYLYWLSEDDPLPWFINECGEMCTGWQAGQSFAAISHQQIGSHLKTLTRLAELPDGKEALSQLLTLPAHMDIVRLYKEIPDRLVNDQGLGGTPLSLAGAGHFAENRKLLFLFRIMETRGLFLIHEESLREINRSLVHLVQQQSFEEIRAFLVRTFSLLKANIRKYPYTSLQCIQVLGTEVFKRGNSRLVEAFLWETAQFGFQYANVKGVDENWQPLCNPAHLTNIRVWLSLIMQEPKWCSTLLSALIINLKLSGTCIKDTDLFQRDVSRLLNHPIEPVYNLVKQFNKLLPVFFNEIGAEGLLRDVSTEIDEIRQRQDILIHFLRKQSHVESTNLIVDFIREIFVFWKTGEVSRLTPYLPQEVLTRIARTGPLVDDLRRLSLAVFSQPSVSRVEDLLEWDEHRLEGFLVDQQDISAPEKRRFALLVKMFKLTNQKYNLGLQDLRQQLKQAAGNGFPEMEQLLADLEICEPFYCLAALLDALEGLKKVILFSETFEPSEDIYQKRHIAADIPSIYGRYRERKFDALGLTFRLENLANIYLEKLPGTLNLSFVTRVTFSHIIKCLKLYFRALAIDGISCRRLETHLSLLEHSLGIKRFSYTQYLDIFRGLSEGVKDVIYAYYTNIHENNLSIIIPQISKDNLLPRYLGLWNDEEPIANLHRLSEAFLRDMISTTFGLQHLDNLITRIYQTLERQEELLDEKKLDLLMTYDPEKAISFFHQKNGLTFDLIHLGNKGYNLTVLADLGVKVPPGFIITTEIFRCRSVVMDFSTAKDELMTQLRHGLARLEEMTGRIYGDPQNPLLLSVRSGAAISMPGMMGTIHYVGLNQDLVDEFARASNEAYFAWDNYRRFLQSWAMTQGVDREAFQVLMDAAKTRYDVTLKSEFTPEQMRELALEYQKKVLSVGLGIPDDPWLQLVNAIDIVFHSWDAKKTVEYRNLMDISEAWGTAVIIQVMVYGNRGQNSGSGVLFTAHPYRKVRRVALWGDYTPATHGEDIVSGLVSTYPISVEQAEIDGRPTENALENRFPEIYAELLALSRELVYERRWNPQEIEFTFEGPKACDLSILQTRDMITIKTESVDVFVETPALSVSLLGKGIGVSGGALSGRAVFTAANILKLRRRDSQTPLILIRQDTVPEDIKEISMADGLLTARGGQTSHASVVAFRLGKTCVVGCRSLRVYENENRCEINGQVIQFGDEVSIDGRKGLFLKGCHEVKKEVRIQPL